MFTQSDNTFRQALKYLLFSGFAALTNVTSRYFLSTTFSTFYSLSISIAYILGLMVNYVLNSNFNFPKSSRSNAQVQITFFIVGLGGLILTELISHLFLFFFKNILVINYSSEEIELFSHILAVSLVVFYSFFAHKYFTYKEGIWQTIKPI